MGYWSHCTDWTGQLGHPDCHHDEELGPAVPTGLNQQALEDFAKMADASIIHPSAILGKVVRNSNELLGERALDVMDAVIEAPPLAEILEVGGFADCWCGCVAGQPHAGHGLVLH